MKNLVLASVLSSVATALAVPALSGPVHFAITRPFSLFGWLPNSGGSAPSTVTLGTVPLDFILTDVMVGTELYRQVVVTVNGSPALNCATGANGYAAGCHLSTGVFVPAGSTIAVEASMVGIGVSTPAPVTIAGYVQ